MNTVDITPARARVAAQKFMQLWNNRANISAREIEDTDHMWEQYEQEVRYQSEWNSLYGEENPFDEEWLATEFENTENERVLCIANTLQ